MVKAIGMFSGGLDSSVAIKLIQEQGIEVIALHFKSPFGVVGSEKRIEQAAKELRVRLVIIEEGMDFVKTIKKPKHGYGSAMNPCIDCRVRRLKVAKRIAEKIGASFIFTGEVLRQRPMSQHMRAMKLIEKEAGLEGKLLRPLSAKLLPPTEAEKKGLVDREKLLAICGRRRVEQTALAEKYGIASYFSPGGGCPLTERDFAAKLRDLLENKKKFELRDVFLLRYGRHFRFGKNKIIVGRNEKDNEMLLELKGKIDLAFEVPGVGSPITILQGPKTKKAIETAASLTARYSDSADVRIRVEYWRDKKRNTVSVSPADDELCRRYMLLDRRTV